MVFMVLMEEDSGDSFEPLNPDPNESDVSDLEEYDVDEIYARGIRYYYEGDIDQALNEFRLVLGLDPDHKKAFIKYDQAELFQAKIADAEFAFMRRDYQKAYHTYSEALLIDHQNNKVNAKLHYHKATAAAELNRFEESIKECSEAINLDNDYLEAILRRAKSYIEVREYELAISDYERACESDRSLGYMLQDAKNALTELKDIVTSCQVLEVDKDASYSEIKKAYRKKAKIYHPDKHAGASKKEIKRMEGEFKQLKKAQDILLEKLLPENELAEESDSTTDEEPQIKKFSRSYSPGQNKMNAEKFPLEFWLIPLGVSSIILCVTFYSFGKLIPAMIPILKVVIPW